jgi:hypothetical protein
MGEQGEAWRSNLIRDSAAIQQVGQQLSAAAAAVLLSTNHTHDLWLQV